ncbi:MAG: hypothetical protein IT437_00895 [Phycisphaerales bacterium]|nr:hypothetical protein [Phycisphaerales bacterium]
MKSGIIRWTIYLAAVLAIGPIAGMLIAGLRASDGALDATPLLSTTPLLGMGLALAAAALATIPGVLSAALVDPKAGLIASGMVLAWPAYRSASITGLFQSAPSSSVLVRLSIEGIAIGAMAIGVSWLVELAGRRRTPPTPKEKAPTLAELLPALGAAVVAGAAAAWAIAQTPLTGQAFAAACVGGVAAGAAAHLVDPRTPLTLGVAAVGVLGVVGPLTGFISGDVVTAARLGTLFPLASLTPLHWAAGGLAGVPMGVAWAASMMEKKPEPAKAA